MSTTFQYWDFKLAVTVDLTTVTEEINNGTGGNKLKDLIIKHLFIYEKSN